MRADEQGLEQWLEAQYRRAADGMLMSVSPVGVIKRRPGFGQTVRPRRGAIVASPVLADWNPEPDYFFHWFRDSAIVIDALRLLLGGAGTGGEALRHFRDFIDFSLSLQALDGRELIADGAWRERCAADFRQFLRDDMDLAQVRDESVVADVRVNADATLDISSWARPQHDGAPLRALMVLRWANEVSFDSVLAHKTAQLVRSDLQFTSRHWRDPSFDIWEEEKGLHYYTLCVSAAALEAGARWLERTGDPGLAAAYGADVQAIRRELDGFWLPQAGHYRSRILVSGIRSAKELDIAVILAAIHGAGVDGSHTVQDPRMHATLKRLEGLFSEAYPINQARPAWRAPAMGRYAGDVYFSGGAYYFSTLGAAEFCFRAAAGGAGAADWIERGDAFLETVRAFTPAGGAMSEQFDQLTGAQTSARHLAWSYAGFISCVAARRAALRPS